MSISCPCVKVADSTVLQGCYLSARGHVNLDTLDTCVDWTHTTETLVSTDWFKGKADGNHGFSWMFPCFTWFCFVNVSLGPIHWLYPYWFYVGSKSKQIFTILQSMDTININQWQSCLVDQANRWHLEDQIIQKWWPELAKPGISLPCYDDHFGFWICRQMSPGFTQKLLETEAIYNSICEEYNQPTCGSAWNLLRSVLISFWHQDSKGEQFPKDNLGLFAKSAQTIWYKSLRWSWIRFRARHLKL